MTSRRQDRRRKTRVLVILVSEAAPQLAERWMLEGRLPHLSRLRSQGYAGRLLSSLPLEPTVQFCNLLTGKGAGKHGKLARDWQRSPDGGFEIRSPAQLREPYVWELLAEENLSSVVLDVPAADPRQKIQGGIFHFRGSSLDSSSRVVFDDLASRFGIPRAVPIERIARATFASEISQQMASQTDIAMALLREQVPDFMVIDFSGLNTVQHYFWHTLESTNPSEPGAGFIQTTFENVDEQIGRLIQGAEADTAVFVVSQCGAGLLKHGFQMNAWLRTQGFQERDAFRALKRSSIRSFFRAFPRRLLPRIAYRKMPNLVARTSAHLRTHMNAPDFDWRRTRAFAMGEDGLIFINRKDLHSQGVVEPSDYELLREQIASRLMELKDPEDGERVVERVHRGEELFSGPYARYCPDLVIEWHRGAYSVCEVEEGDTVFRKRFPLGLEQPLTGGHTREGLLVARAPGLEPEAIQQMPTIFDLVPTWLSLLGVPLPKGLEGKSLVS